MKKRSILALSALPILLSTTSAWAAMDAKTFATNLYEQQKKSITAQGATVTETGVLTVTEEGKYFAVTYPALTIHDDKHKIELGPIRQNLMPDPNGKDWKMTFAIPSPIKMSMQNGSKPVDFTIGHQALSAIINETTLFPRMIDAKYKDLRLTSPDQGTTMAFGDITAHMNYVPDSTGLLSGPFVFTINNLSFDAKGPEVKEPGHLKLESLNVDGYISQMDSTMIHTYNEKISELTGAGLTPEKINSPESMSALWKIVMDYGLQQADGAKANITFKNFEFTKPAISDKPEEQFKLDEMGYRFDTSGLRGDKSNSDFAFTLKGLHTTGTDAELSKFLPQTINLSFGYKHLPHKALMQQLGSLATAGMGMDKAKTADCTTGKEADCVKSNAATAQMMAMQAMMTVPALLAQAGTVFTINNTDIRSPDYGVNINGQFTASPNAVLGGNGSSKVIFSGLDALVADLQALSAKPDTKPEIVTKTKQAVQGLAAMQMFGQQGTDTAGKPARIYDFVIDEKGSMKLNGTDMSMLTGAKGAPAEQTDTTGTGSPDQTPSK